MKIALKKIIVLTLILAAKIGLAQNMNYQFQISHSTYSDIHDETVLSTGANWLNNNQSIPIGFNFNYLGTVFQAVSVTDDGYILFGTNYRFYCFGLGLSNQKDSAGQNLSSISYIVKGDSGHRVLKIQFKNCKILNDTAGYINFQVRLHERNNKIDILVGETRFDPAALNATAQIVGLWDQANQNGLLLTGAANSASAVQVSSGASPARISGFPDLNVKYEFIPNF